MKWCVTILFLLIQANLLAQNFQTANGSVVFLSKAPLSEFEGKSAALKGLVDLDNNVLDFYLDLNTLKTGIGLRDKHMRDNYLETKKFPFAEFTGKMLNIEDITLEELKKGKEVSAKGVFKIHGVNQERTIKGTLKLSDNGQNLELETYFEVALKDHNIAKPSVMGYDLADVQEVSIRATFKRQ
jgi:polyisoprenoid-binding protein YceI